VNHPIRSAAVLGAGTMGAQIAAHLANAGVPVLLLDLTAEVAREGLKRARGLKPDPFFTPAASSLVGIGGLDADLPRLASADWIIEAIVENLDIKRGLLERVDAVRGAHAIVSSNTSGIPIAALGQGRSEGFRRHWLGTHFFNPPRYLRLLEIIPTAETDPAVVDRLSRFADFGLGKGVVVAKDTPNFIANHIGMYSIAQILRVLAAGEFTIEEIDAMTGPAIGRPRSATFRTIDIAGLDILGHVAKNFTERLTDQALRQQFTLPPIMQSMIEKGWIGEKAGQGFYKREASGLLALDPATLTYRPLRPARLPALDAVRNVDDVAARTRTLFLGKDNVGAFLRATLGPLLLYTARVALDIAPSIDAVDRAMKWGYGWELGPFETWDAIGIQEVISAVDETADRPRLADDMLRSGRNRFRDGDVPPAGPGLQILKAAKDLNRVLRRNSAASLVDLGDGVLAVEFHSKLNTIGADTVQMLHNGASEAAANFAALVIGNDAPNFSAGANLMLVLLEAQEGNWEEIDLMVRAFQRANMALRAADVPVVVAPAGLTLGGGCEIALHGDRVQAAAESYIGLVEAGVGLIPAGGGVKEMVARSATAMPSVHGDLLPAARHIFETIGFAKVSTSAADSRRLGFVREVDGVTMNRERLMADAKAVALDRVRAGYRAPAPRTEIPVGGEGVLAALKLGVHLAWRGGHISDHDALIGRTLAFVIAGGALPHQTTVGEEYLLDLEREAFLKLCGEPKTRERMQYTLKTGKTLRN
jgi:3-hydroxyacyl-CoA dehydrogenase